MRHDVVFNYDYLLSKIQDKYKETTINKNINALCKDIHYLTPFRFKHVVIDKRGYFLQNEVLKISTILSLSDEDIIKCFYTIDK